MGAAENLASIPETADWLEIRDAVEYLKSIGVKRISVRTLYNRMNTGTGPQRYKRSGRLYFRKVDLDAWKKSETEVIQAYA